MFSMMYFCFVSLVARLDAANVPCTIYNSVVYAVTPIISIMSQSECTMSINNLRHVQGNSVQPTPRYHCASYNIVYHPKPSTPISK